MRFTNSRDKPWPRRSDGMVLGRILNGATPAAAKSAAGKKPSPQAEESDGGDDDDDYEP